MFRSISKLARPTALFAAAALLLLLPTAASAYDRENISIYDSIAFEQGYVSAPSYDDTVAPTGNAGIAPGAVDTASSSVSTSSVEHVLLRLDQLFYWGLLRYNLF